MFVIQPVVVLMLFRVLTDHLYVSKTNTKLFLAADESVLLRITQCVCGAGIRCLLLLCVMWAHDSPYSCNELRT